MIKVLDTTLREGEQTPGVYFDKHIKLAAAELLDEIGIDIIEAGHPSVTSEIFSAVKTISSAETNALIGAHARSVINDIEKALECGVDFIGIFYCVSDERLNGVFKRDLSEAIRQITKSIDYAKSHKSDLKIRYTPEDTVRSQFENVITASVEAVYAGADIISVADTTGYMFPGTSKNMYDFIAGLKTEFEKRKLTPQIAVHCHNDKGMALANALEGIRAGAEIIDASVLGLGERAGIVDLAQLLVALRTEFGVEKYNLSKLPGLYRLISTHSGIEIPQNFPITGKNAFTHCAGVHTHAAALNPMHYESLSPELLGRERTFSLDHMSGIASLKYALNLIDQTKLDDELQADILSEVKSIGQRGRTVDLQELNYIVNSCRLNKRYKQSCA